MQDSSTRLQRQLAERTKLMSQLEQAKMQESVAKSLQQMSDMAVPSNTPTLDEVRDKIERRYATALGQADLAETSVAGRMLDVQRATADLQGAARLQEIRASMQAEHGAFRPRRRSRTARPRSGARCALRRAIHAGSCRAGRPTHRAPAGKPGGLTRDYSPRCSAATRFGTTIRHASVTSSVSSC